MAIEIYRNSWFTHSTWWISIVMWLFTRGYPGAVESTGVRCCEMLWDVVILQIGWFQKNLATSTTQHVDFPCFQMDVHSIGFRYLQISPGLLPVPGARGPISTMEGQAAVSAATSRTACLGQPWPIASPIWSSVLDFHWVYKVYTTSKHEV